jgi:hypothetical protein
MIGLCSAAKSQMEVSAKPAYIREYD